MVPTFWSPKRDAKLKGPMPRTPMPSGKDEIVRLIQETLGPKVKFALLFGSVLKPSFRDESDVDIAAYFKEDVDPSDRLDLQAQIESKIHREIDLIVLNDADIVITMQVLANGECILCEDSTQLARFKALKISEYIDFKRSRKVVEDHLMSPGRPRKRGAHA